MNTHYTHAMAEEYEYEYAAVEHSLENYDMPDIDIYNAAVFVGTGDDKRLVARFFDRDLCFDFINTWIYSHRQGKMTRIDDCERVYSWNFEHGALDVMIKGLDY